MQTLHCPAPITSSTQARVKPVPGDSRQRNDALSTTPAHWRYYYHHHHHYYYYHHYNLDTAELSGHHPTLYAQSSLKVVTLSLEDITEHSHLIRPVHAVRPAI